MHRLYIENALLLLILLHLHHQAAESAPVQKRFRICGARLSNVLKLICSNEGGKYPDFRWLTDSSGQSSGQSSGKGVSTECCKTTCTYRTLVTYCDGAMKPREAGENELMKLGLIEALEGSSERQGGY